MDFAERAGRNEEIFRDVNRRIEEGAEQHAVSGRLPFHCECGRASCVETIEIPTGRYEAIVRQRYRFVVIPGHEEPKVVPGIFVSHAERYPRAELGLLRRGRLQRRHDRDRRKE